MMNHKIISQKKVVEYDFFQLEKAKIEIDTFKGSKDTIIRYGLLRPQVVAIVLYRKDIDCLVIIEQFRYSSLRTGDGWMKEIVAGIVEDGEEITAAAQRESLEESGYQIKNLEKCFQFYPSAGLSNQLIHLFYGEVTAQDRIADGGGLENEQEDIRVHEIPSQKLFEEITQGKINDAKTLIGLQWFFLIKKPTLTY